MPVPDGAGDGAATEATFRQQSGAYTLLEVTIIGYLPGDWEAPLGHEVPAAARWHVKAAVILVKASLDPIHGAGWKSRLEIDPPESR